MSIEAHECFSVVQVPVVSLVGKTVWTILLCPMVRSMC